MPLTTSLRGWRWSRIVTDVLLGCVAVALAFWVRIAVPLPFTLSLLPQDRLRFFTTSLLLVLASQNVLLYFFGFYELPRPREGGERSRRLLAATFAQGLLLIGYYFFAEARFPRTVLLLTVAFNFSLLWLGRRVLDLALRPPRLRAAIAGCGPRAHELARALARHDWYGLEVVGHVRTPADESETESRAAAGPGPLLGTVDDLPQLVRDGRVNEVLLASAPDTWQSRLVDRLARDGEEHCGVLLLPGPFESLVGRMRYRSVHDIPLIEVVRENEWHRARPLKRAADAAIAALALLLAAPLIALCGLLIRIGSPGPVFYRQTRVGRHQRPFTLWKLRTMRVDAETAGEQLASEDDPRKTRIGRFLRRFRLDELPQLWNVLNGTMSLVGPRPERPGFVREFLERVPGYGARFAVRPGLTGLAQINGDYHSDPENKLRYDLAYLANSGAWTDLSILLRTIRIVLTSRGV